METEIQVLKEMNRAIQVQIKTKDTDNQRLNIKIKRLEKTAEIRESILSNAVDTKVTIKNGIPSYNQAVSPRPVKTATRKVSGETIGPRSLHEMKGTDEESSSATLAPLKKDRNKTTPKMNDSIMLPPIASKPPIPDMQPLKKDFKQRAQEVKERIRNHVGTPYNPDQAADAIIT